MRANGLPPRAPQQANKYQSEYPGAKQAQQSNNLGPPSTHSRYGGSAAGSANGYDANSIAVRSNLQKAANRALGDDPTNAYASRSPMVQAGHRPGGKADFLS